MSGLQQGKLIKKFKEYIAAKGDVVPDDLDIGLCAGLVANELYYAAIDKEDVFLEKMQKAISWQSNDFTSTNPKINVEMEEFLHNILGLHDIAKVLPDISSTDMRTSINTLLDASLPKIAKPEFSLSFLFNKEELEKILGKIVFDKKMIRISNGFHVLGLMRKNGIYKFYDPEAEQGIQNFKDPDDLAREIIQDLGAHIDKQKSSMNMRDYMAINFTIYDLEGNAPAEYFDAVNYCEQQMRKLEVKRFINDRYLFFVLSKFNEFKIMDLLFSKDYKFQAWTISDTPELIDAVKYNNEQKVAYLLDHDVPIDKKTDSFLLSALGKAIENNNLKIIYALLKHGANPNLAAKHGVTYLDLALSNNALQAIILLLASGMELKQSDFLKLQQKVGPETLDIISRHALALHAKLLGLSNNINIDLASGSDLSKLARQAKLQTQLQLQDAPLDGIKITYKNETVQTTNELVQIILNIYNAEVFSERLNAIDHDQLYQALLFFYPNLQNISLDQVGILAQKMQQVEATISARHAATNQDLLEIQILIDYASKLKFELSDQEEQSLNTTAEKLYAHKPKTIQTQFKSVFSNPSLLDTPAPDIADAELKHALRLTID